MSSSASSKDKKSTSSRRTSTQTVSSLEAIPAPKTNARASNKWRKTNPKSSTDESQQEKSKTQQLAAAAPSAKVSSPTKEEVEGSTAKATAASKQDDESSQSSSRNSAKPASGAATAGASSSGLPPKKTYVMLVHDAIEAIKDRTGSSIPAIKKWVLSEYPTLEQTPPNVLNKRLIQALKTGVGQKRFEKIRCSYKVTASWRAAHRKRKPPQKPKPPPSSTTNSATSTSNVNSKSNPSKEKDPPPQISAAARAQEARERERQERIKKRRFPMEDALLHKEDKELGVKPPSDVTSRPHLPYFWQYTTPIRERKGGKTSDAILRHSKVDTVEFSRGLVPDLLQVYHFFRGDLHFGSRDVPSLSNEISGGGGGATTRRSKRGTGKGATQVEGSSVSSLPLSPEFSLSQLIHACDEILNGTARKCKLIPPLLSHLFVVCLQLLCGPLERIESEQGQTSGSGIGIGGVVVTDMTAPRKLLQTELYKFLWPALTPASWGDICHLYMDAMERYYTTDSSLNQNVLQPLVTDLNYVLGRTDHRKEVTTPVAPKGREENMMGNESTEFGNQKLDDSETDADLIGSLQGPSQIGNLPLPDGYWGYFGDSRGSLYRAHEKLGRQEVWALTAEELLSLLRALTDDVIALFPQIGRDVAQREERMIELLKAKKVADSLLRKTRLAYEGPKKAKKNSSSVNDEGKPVAEGSHVDENQSNGKINGGTFKPTATKKEFDSALRAQQKANAAYEDGIRRLVARSEPVGYDRNFNAVYCFRHDPEVLFVEDLRAPLAGNVSLLPSDLQNQRRSWHLIETTSLFDSFIGSLDIRGKREHDLHESLLGPMGTQQSLRRYLKKDDVKEKAEAASRKRELESLEKRVEVAKIKCDEDQGRRSGRLAGPAEQELARVQQELKELQESNEEESTEANETKDPTGLSLLQCFDNGDRTDKRRTREVKGSKKRMVPLLPCTALIPSGNIDGSGLVGMVVASLLELEEKCQNLSPWARTDGFRQSWISRVEGAVYQWYSLSCQDATSSKIDGSTASNGSKRRRSDPAGSSNASGPAISSILGALKPALLDLEERVADITYLSIANRDAEIADDNMSVDEDSSDKAEKERLEMAWKRMLHRIRSTTLRKHQQIKKMVVQAISLARKAHNPDVVAELRAALLLCHAKDASECRAEVEKILLKHGDYDESKDDDNLLDEADGEESLSKEKEDETQSVLSAEAALLGGSLGGNDESTRSEWRELVKSCRTMSRLSSLTAGFVHAAEERLAKVEEERETFLDVLSSLKKSKRKNRKAESSDSSEPSEVWADVTFTSEIVMARTEDWPWWPARRCKPKDGEVEEALSEVDRGLVALVGEMGGLRLVKNEDIQEFTGKALDEDLSGVKRKIRSQLDECLTMACRIVRASEKKDKKLSAK